MWKVRGGEGVGGMHLVHMQYKDHFGRLGHAWRSYFRHANMMNNSMSPISTGTHLHPGRRVTLCTSADSEWRGGLVHASDA